MISKQKDELMATRGYARVAVVAEKTKIHPGTIFRLIKEGKLKTMAGPGTKYLSLASVVHYLGREQAEACGLLKPGAPMPALDAPASEPPAAPAKKDKPPARVALRSKTRAAASR